MSAVPHQMVHNQVPKSLLLSILHACSHLSLSKKKIHQITYEYENENVGDILMFSTETSIV
jgi:hypothetical protein